MMKKDGRILRPFLSLSLMIPPEIADKPGTVVHLYLQLSSALPGSNANSSTGNQTLIAPTRYLSIKAAFYSKRLPNRMIALAKPSVSQKVLHIISQVSEIKPSRLKTSSHLNKEFSLDNLDVVNIIWELEKSFKIVIPDEVPLNTVGDFVEIVSTQTEKKG
ncbi:acyl carrier protein [Rufibacter sediminis]|nr:acyl carrier protein [Rufibacter sediminis]